MTTPLVFEVGRRYLTRDGRTARVICVDRDNPVGFTMVALVADGLSDRIKSLRSDGREDLFNESVFDLVAEVPDLAGPMFVGAIQSMLDNMSDAGIPRWSVPLLAVCQHDGKWIETHGLWSTWRNCAGCGAKQEDVAPATPPPAWLTEDN